MAKHKTIPIETLRQLLDYNPDTGEIFWKPRPLEMFSAPRFQRRWNTRYAGGKAFTFTRKTERTAYLVGCIFHRVMQAHRVIWALLYGKWPDQIDHIDHNGANNRIENLRDVGQSENMKNQPLHKRNTTGTAGVCWHKVCRKWAVQITVGNKHLHLGVFDLKADAVARRKAAEIEHGYHPNHGR